MPVLFEKDELEHEQWFGRNLIIVHAVNQPLWADVVLSLINANFCRELLLRFGVNCRIGSSRRHMVDTGNPLNTRGLPGGTVADQKNGVGPW